MKSAGMRTSGFRALVLLAAFSLFGMTRALADGAVIAHFDLGQPIVETPQGMPPLFGGAMPESMKGLLERMKAAREDANVKAVVLEIENPSMGLAQLEEIYGALRQFKAVGKPVYLNVDGMETPVYALACAATHVSIVPTGDLWLTGILSESPYFRGMLDKLHIEPQMLQCGDYKSAFESFMLKEPSPESKEMLNWLLDGIYDRLVTMIAEGRNKSAEEVRKLIDNGPYTAEDALKAGLIDSVQHRQDFVRFLKSRYGENVDIQRDYGSDLVPDMPTDPFALLNTLMEMMNPIKRTSAKPKIAVVYVEGAIQTGEGEVSPFGGSSGAFSTTIRKGLDAAREDDSVKAVVLRVDSPGGSALASEIILDAVRRVQAAGKPVIVSMGNVAGSGGYYVACSGDAILAQESTITASIGVIGGKFVTTGGWDKLGINWSTNQRGAMAAMMSGSAPWSQQERDKLMGYMNYVYGIFKGHVMEFRGKKLSQPIDQLAGGRVFTGKQALERGLVDRIGGLEDALALAAEKSGLGDYETEVLPEPPSLFQLLMGQEGGKGYSRMSLSENPFGPDSPLGAIFEAAMKLDPARARAVVTGLARLELLNSEHVILMTPFDWAICSIR